MSQTVSLKPLGVISGEVKGEAERLKSIEASTPKCVCCRVAAVAVVEVERKSFVAANMPSELAVAMGGRRVGITLSHRWRTRLTPEENSDATREKSSSRDEMRKRAGIPDSSLRDSILLEPPNTPDTPITAIGKWNVYDQIYRSLPSSPQKRNGLFSGSNFANKEKLNQVRLPRVEPFDEENKLSPPGALDVSGSKTFLDSLTSIPMRILTTATKIEIGDGLPRISESSLAAAAAAASSSDASPVSAPLSVGERIESASFSTPERTIEATPTTGDVVFGFRRKPSRRIDEKSTTESPKKLDPKKEEKTIVPTKFKEEATNARFQRGTTFKQKFDVVDEDDDDRIDDRILQRSLLMVKRLSKFKRNQLGYEPKSDFPDAFRLDDAKSKSSKGKMSPLLGGKSSSSSSPSSSSSSPQLRSPLVRSFPRQRPSHVFPAPPPHSPQRKKRIARRKSPPSRLSPQDVDAAPLVVVGSGPPRPAPASAAAAATAAIRRHLHHQRRRGGGSGRRRQTLLLSLPRVDVADEPVGCPGVKGVKVAENSVEREGGERWAEEQRGKEDGVRELKSEKRINAEKEEQKT